MCESELQKVQSECIQLVDYLKWIIPGGVFRKMATEQLGSVAISFVDPWSETILGSSREYVSASNSNCDLLFVPETNVNYNNILKKIYIYV